MTKSREQAWLENLVGEWTYDFVVTGEPGVAQTGRETVRMIGMWLVAENRSDGDDSAMLTTIGYEPKKGVFTGAAVATMVSELFVLSGSLERDGSALLVESEGPALTPGKASDRYRDVWRVTGPDSREMIAEVLEETGEWREFMRYVYKRA